MFHIIFIEQRSQLDWKLFINLSLIEYVFALKPHPLVYKDFPVDSFQLQTRQTIPLKIDRFISKICKCYILLLLVSFFFQVKYLVFT